MSALPTDSGSKISLTRKVAAASAASIQEDAKDTARRIGLRYVNDALPGISRKPFKDGFRYLLPDGKPVRDEATLQRIRSLAVPPAYRDVWICPLENGHLQATGRDARGRKQYRYHPQWRTVRDENKYQRMIGFANALPALRERVERDMAQPGLARDKVIATVVHLLQTTMMRVGNEEYARTNRSYGLTTLRTRHVKVKGTTLEFAFRGKSGVSHAIKLSDRRLAGIVRKMRDLPGQELFQYLDDEGNRHAVDSADVNDYLRQATGEDYTAKDFRTWAGTMLAALELRAFEHCESETQARKNITAAIETVSGKLGNTPSICRKCYVHPVVIEAYLDGSMHSLGQEVLPKACASGKHALTPEESSIVTLLQQRMTIDADRGTSSTKTGRSRRARQA